MDQQAPHSGPPGSRPFNCPVRGEPRQRFLQGLDVKGLRMRARTSCRLGTPTPSPSGAVLAPTAPRLQHRFLRLQSTQQLSPFQLRTVWLAQKAVGCSDLGAEGRGPPAPTWSFHTPCATPGTPLGHSRAQCLLRAHRQGPQQHRPPGWPVLLCEGTSQSCRGHSPAQDPPAVRWSPAGPPGGLTSSCHERRSPRLPLPAGGPGTEASS